MMKINNFRGELTDISAEKEALYTAAVALLTNLESELSADLITASLTVDKEALSE